MIRPGDWRPADGLQLEPNALRTATEQARNLALTAGPGAGKTEMLAQRADFLLRTNLCRYPKRILAISFKVDASRNLKSRVQKRCGRSLASRLDSHTFHAFAKRIIDRFRPVLTGVDALDPDYQIGDRRVTQRQITFGDLVPFATEILRSSVAARNAVRQTYSHVFLDEFQDCTGEQYRLIKLAFEGTDILLTAVGDTKQRIMGWAGALEGIFLDYARDFNAIPLNLYRNFRSLPLLRRMQNAMIQVMDTDAAVPDEDIEGEGGEILILPFDDSQQEAIGLADLMQEWIEVDGLPPAEIAVLVSREPDYFAKELMDELEQRGIPFRNEQQLQDISVEPAARLVVDYLTVVYGDREPGAYIRLMDLLGDAGLDDEEQEALRLDWHRYLRQERLGARQNGSPTFDIVWEAVISFLRRFTRPRLIALSADYEHGARLADVLRGVRGRIADLLEIEPILVNALSRFSDDQAVRIMTIHKSKGLEFESVILLGVERETFWGNEDAERSAYFVGVSRAKSKLILTCAEERPMPTGYPNPTRWRVRRRQHEEFLGYAEPFIYGDVQDAE
jgi:superfamily I DNA/RNA helicase